MLKFWKKQERKQLSNAAADPYPLQLHEQNSIIPTQLQTTPLMLLDDEDYGKTETTEEKSRLCRTLEDVLADKRALSYFIQYMDMRNASSYILCYLDIETFKNDFVEPTDVPAKLSSPVINRSDHDSLSVSTDCDSLTADSNSLFDYIMSLESKTSDYNSPSETCEVDYFKDKSADKLVESALVIFKKYIALEAKLNITCPEGLRKEVMENICDSGKIKSRICFESVQNYLFEVLKNDYFGAFLDTDFYSKHQIDILTSGNVVLGDILYNETALFYFMEFLEQENKRNLLEFWIAATNLELQLNTQKEFFDPVEAQNDAIVLYDKYFSLQAHCPLGFSDKVRFSVEQSICGENGLNIDCFQIPLRVVECYLQKHYLAQFLGSQLFYKYLSELINSVQASGYSTTIEHYSPSDCSSEKSFSTSTFLALELPYEKKKDVKANMSIDSRELYDPDTLWKRKKTQRLSLGRVTELGKYIADIEPEPDKKGFKLKNVVKKIVSLDDEEKRKEEMAWKVAEMIVKDITNVTLSDNHPP